MKKIMVIIILLFGIWLFADNFQYEITATGSVASVDTLKTKIDIALQNNFSYSRYTIKSVGGSDSIDIAIYAERTEIQGDLDNSVIVNYLFNKIDNCRIIIDTEKHYVYEE